MGCYNGLSLAPLVYFILILRSTNVLNNNNNNNNNNFVNLLTYFSASQSPSNGLTLCFLMTVSFPATTLSSSHSTFLFLTFVFSPWDLYSLRQKIIINSNNKAPFRTQIARHVHCRTMSQSCNVEDLQSPAELNSTQSNSTQLRCPVELTFTLCTGTSLVHHEYRQL